ncbi:MAG: hypothetical protein EOO89_00240 [Pedobacter sp.]|nr:MAG: hypothetical protein EOO89_00240 [Pedobacter sp.]
MDAHLRFKLYIAAVAIAFACSLFRLRVTGRAFRTLSALLGITLVAESVAHYYAMVYHNNLAVYHVYTPALLILTAIYYHQASPLLRKYNMGFAISILAVIMAIVNSLYLQPIHTFNSNYVLFTGFCIISMALTTFYQYYTDNKEINLTRNPEFQVSLVFLFYWSSTFISYAFHEVLPVREFHKVYWFIWLVNMATYSSLALIFIFYPKQPERSA